jgi:hypothetical protein
LGTGDEGQAFTGRLIRDKHRYRNGKCSIGHLFGFIDFGHQFQILDALANGDSKLMRVNNARKYFGLPLTACAFD